MANRSPKIAAPQIWRENLQPTPIFNQALWKLTYPPFGPQQNWRSELENRTQNLAYFTFIVKNDSVQHP